MQGKGAESGATQRRLLRGYDIFDPVYTIRMNWEGRREAFQAERATCEGAVLIGDFQQLRGASKLKDMQESELNGLAL